jgi:4-alpha-glucanotransferase
VKVAKERTLRELAAACGVQAHYRDIRSARKPAARESTLAALSAMGIIEGESDAPRALRELRKAAASRLVDPVIVAWDGRGAFSANARTRLACILELESGGGFEWACPPGAVCRFPQRLPAGRHRLTIRSGGRSASATVLSAPRTLPSSEDRQLGVFIPLYALRGARDRGAGDLGDLRRLCAWAADHGCDLVGTLPLLASYIDKRPFEPSPYSPVSRLFWNEFYLDLPGLKRTPARGESLLVDYHAVMRAKRAILEKRAARAFAVSAQRRQIEDFLRERPEVRDYAAFRAEVEARGTTWQEWPDSRRAGRLPRADSPAARYHIYAQYLLDEQLREVAKSPGAAVYLDLPIGVNGGGYDVWRYRDAFVTDASTGAPPDALFAGGQDWGFPPPHPMRTREDGHAYFAACLRNHFRYARVLRIDHVMGLHRLYWIPRGIDARQGLYVRYPAEELYAVLSIEAHRAGARIIGENLGTVPEQVNRSMARHGIMGMFIGQFAFAADSAAPMSPAPAGTLASLNTHDTPTFAGYVRGSELDLRVRVGILDASEASSEQRARKVFRRALTAYARKRLGSGHKNDELLLALRALLRDLAASDASILLVNLEDLWLDPDPQNIPGISAGYPCWRKRTRCIMDEFMQDRRISSLLRELSQLRQRRTARAHGDAAA